MNFAKKYPSSDLGASAYVNLQLCTELRVGPVTADGSWTVFAVPTGGATPVRLDVTVPTITDANAWLAERMEWL